MLEVRGEEKDKPDLMEYLAERVGEIIKGMIMKREEEDEG